ncbi:hypothetical protein [Streptomyces benahoarensis]|uniref:Uncharacterized protein n=1 Tax=Streptomyces benahoarensis TaxID=2595054 RepID=A0A553ZPU5_9ACTN|nr:hypothetical protein [Streptomyces benahoarensis]TSB31562.1 hypothetical protein FNJ62_05705 [Streptomyces benahoarensis]TSB43484.1 hypothetical protein FNZ23_04135 [Streptomyces benahoarensis]
MADDPLPEEAVDHSAAPIPSFRNVMPHMFRTPAMPHWAEFATLLATIYVSDRLYSLTVADQFAHWNQWVRPLPFALASIALLVFVVMPGPPTSGRPGTQPRH